MTNIKSLHNKKAKRDAAAYLGLTMDEFEAGLGDISGVKNPMIDLDTILAKLVRAEDEAKAARRKQLLEARDRWLLEMNKSEETKMHRKSLSTGNALCWVDEVREYEAKVSRKTDEITCQDCAQIYNAMMARVG